MSFPGYLAIVGGECTSELAIEALDANNSYLRNLCNEVLYTAYVPDYNFAFRRFYLAVTSALHARNAEHNVRPRNLGGVLTYFYNRQFILQMMSQPTPFPAAEVHIPIDRAPATQLMADILALTEDQVAVNYNLPYLLVIEDPFTRFVWAYPVGRLLSDQVKKAFFLALSRPGIPQEYYHYLRDKITQVVVDGGSEFKNTFPRAFTFAFPRANISTSIAKSKTSGRTTTTGPVEAAIGLVRRVIRGYEWTHDRNFLGRTQAGLNQILETVNTMTSQPLHQRTPTELVQALLHNNVNTIRTAQVYMNDFQEEKIEKQNDILANIGNPENPNPFWVATDPHGQYAYRLYIPPPSFSKLVTVKVSQEVYVIQKQNIGEKGKQIELSIYGQPQNERRIGKIANWQQLVLVRAPVDPGPPQIQAQLQQRIQDLQWRGPTPREVTQAFAIHPDILNAIGQGAPDLQLQMEHQALDRNPIDRNRRDNIPRPQRYR